MADALIISVHFHEGWYHGAGAIPSPARLYQSLVAGIGLSGPLSNEVQTALGWLEQQPPPVLAAPYTKGGQNVSVYVPNNDLDAKQCDPRRIGEIRTKKSIRPLTFDANVPFLFCWNIDDDQESTHQAKQICELAKAIYQLGRGVDAAWAWAEIVDNENMRNRLSNHHGLVLHPCVGVGNVECPTNGSLASLLRRHAGMSQRFSLTRDRKGQAFHRRPKSKWRMVAYDSVASRFSFDMIDRETSKLASWPTTQTVALTKSIRDNAADRLIQAIPDREAVIRQALIGQKPSGENAGPSSARVRIVPLPSIGHEHTDPLIRRVIIDVPGDCPLPADDVRWAFSGHSFRAQRSAASLKRREP